jgi:hypothetical protein
VDARTEVRLRALEAALIRDETADQPLLWADLYAAWVLEDRDAAARAGALLRAVEAASPAEAAPDPAPEPEAPAAPPLPTDFGAFGRAGRPRVFRSA